MSRATNALAILKKNLTFDDLVQLIELLSAELEERSRNYLDDTPPVKPQVKGSGK